MNDKEHKWLAVATIIITILICVVAIVAAILVIFYGWYIIAGALMLFMLPWLIEALKNGADY